MSIRLIASDLDGTLLTDSKELSDKTRQAIAQAAEMGIQIVPATGRAYSSIPKEVLTLPGVEYVITSNGAAIYSVSQGKRIYTCLLEAASVEAILSMDEIATGNRKQLTDETVSGCANGLVTIEGFIDGIPYSDAVYVKNPEKYGATDYGIGYVKRTRTPVQDIRAFLYEHRGELDSLSLVSTDSELLARCGKKMEQSVPDIMTTSSVRNLLEIGHARSGKGHTLAHLLDLLHIAPWEAVACGDAYNDLSMIRLVKYGIAVGNAVKKCKEAAYLVTGTNEEDGVAEAMELLLQ